LAVDRPAPVSDLSIGLVDDQCHLRKGITAVSAGPWLKEAVFPAAGTIVRLHVAPFFNGASMSAGGIDQLQMVSVLVGAMVRGIRRCSTYGI